MQLRQAGLWNSASSVVTRLYGGAYFSYPQAITLDAILATSDQSTEQFRDVVLAATLSTAATLVNTVGKHFAQPPRPFTRDGQLKGSFRRLALRDRGLDAHNAFGQWLREYGSLQTNPHQGTAVQADYMDALHRFGSKVSVVYADPPYTRDHYSRFYHVLETMCLRDNPDLVQVKRNGQMQLSRGVYRTNRHQSPFSVPSEAEAAFRNLFMESARHRLPLVLSYSPSAVGDGTHPRVVPYTKIVSIAHEFYTRVETRVVPGFFHKRLNRKERSLAQRVGAEHLISCSL